MILRGAVSKDGRKFSRVGVNRYHCAAGAVKALALPAAKKSTNAYAAALVTRLTEDWPIIHSSADAANRWSLRQLRARARDLERNGGIHSAYLSALEANIIGSRGIGVQMKVRKGAAGWDDATDYLDAKPVKGRVIEDPRERAFLKAIDSRARRLLGTAGGAKKRAFLRDHEPELKNAIVLAARSLKAGDAIFEQDGDEMTTGGELDRFANYLIEKELKDFSKRGNCDVTGKHSLMDLCRLTLRTSARDGDALLLVYRGFANRWGVAFQLIEGDYLDDYYNVERLPNGNRIRMGVELDQFGRKVAFWVFAHHPGDYGVEGVNSYDPRRRRIAALGCAPDPYFTDGRPESVQAIHVTKSKRAEETRAVPWITPAMQLVHHIETLKEAEITAARAEACKHVVYERDMHSSDGTALEWEEIGGQLTDELQPATSQELPPGVTAKLIDPNHPNPHFPDFLKSMKREVAMALNYCYNTLFGDLESVNYSSIRAGTLNEREASKMDQAWFGDDVFTPMFEVFLEMAILSGALPFRLAEFERLNAPEFKFRRWPWVDPKNDAETAILLIDNKLRTRSQVIADMSSDDFEETIDELDYEAGYIAGKANLAAAEEKSAALENPAPAPNADAPLKDAESLKALALKGWVTINGAHVLIGDNGKISEGPSHLVGKDLDTARSDEEARLDHEAEVRVRTKKFQRMLARRRAAAPAWHAKHEKALPLKSAHLGDTALGELPAEVEATVRQFVPGVHEKSIVTRYGMTVPELLDKADQHNLDTARHHLRNAGVRESKVGVLERKDKFILLLNDRIIDGHHHLAKAEKGKVTSSLAVLDLTPLRYQQAPAV